MKQKKRVYALSFILSDFLIISLIGYHPYRC